MKSIKSLQKNIYKVTSGHFFANWLPDERINVGDFGPIKDGKFIYSANLKDRNLEFSTQTNSASNSTFRYQMKTKIESAGKLSADLQEILGGFKSQFNISFGSLGSFIFDLEGIQNKRLKDRQALLEELGKKIWLEEIKWEDDFVVITEVKMAKKSQVMVCDSNKASLSFACSGDPLEHGSLVKGNMDIKYINQSDSIIEAPSEGQNSPMFHPVRLVFTPGGPGGSPISYKQLKARLKSLLPDQGLKPEDVVIDPNKYVDSLESNDEDNPSATFHIKNIGTYELHFRSLTIEEFLKEYEEDDSGSNSDGTMGNLLRETTDEVESVPEDIVEEEVQIEHYQVRTNAGEAQG